MNKISLYERSEIASQFKNAVSIDDLANLLTKVQNIIANKENQVAITAKSIKNLLYSTKIKKYKSFEIPKKSGGVRKIVAPNKRLLYIQRLLNIILQCVFTPRAQAHGFIEGRSIVSNAKLHTGKNYVYNIDLKDFFPSISYYRVAAVLHKVKEIGLSKEMANIIGNLCCHDGYLPQGAPTSPTLSNFVCIKLDIIFYKHSQLQGYTYSRYADDITISSNKNIFTDGFKDQIFSMIRSEGFDLNPSKERLQINNVIENGKSYRQQQSVTGIIVNKHANVNKSYIRNLEATLYNWEKYGYEIASLLHEHFYKFSKGADRYKGVIPSLENVVMGRIEYLGMVRGKDDVKYQFFKIRFDSLCMKENYTDAEFMEILDIWDREGIEKAMNKFYDKRNLGNNKDDINVQNKISTHGRQ